MALREAEPGGVQKKIFRTRASSQSVPQGGPRKKNRYDFFDVTDDGLTKIGDCRAGSLPEAVGVRRE